MITEIACDCQLGFSFGYGFNQSENKTTKKKAATIFFATDALFMDPKQTKNATVLPPCLPSIWVQLLLLMGLRAAGRW